MAALTTVLVGLTVLVGFEGQFFVDEAALYAQVEIVGDGAWTLPRPFAAEDPGGSTISMNRAAILGDDWAPYVNHPFHVLLYRGADIVGGRVGMRLLSIAGLVAAALTAALMARRWRPRLAIPSLWAVGLASPLLFDGQLVVAHTVGAALVGGLLLTATARASSSSVLASGCLAFAAPMFRSEAVLLGALLAVALVVRGLRSSLDRIDVLRGGVIGAGVSAAYLLEPRFVAFFAGEADPLFVISTSSRDGLEGRWGAARDVLVGTNPGPTTTGGLCALVATATLVAVFVFLQRRRNDLAAMAAVISILASVCFVAVPEVITGVFVAFPVLTVGVLGLMPAWKRLGRDERMITVVITLLAAAILATQYTDAGGPQWGWRYLAVGLPAITYLALRSVEVLIERIDPAGRRLALGTLVTVSVLLPVGGLRELRATLDVTGQVQDAIIEVTADADRVVIVDRLLGRSVWKLSIENRTLTVRPEELPTVLGWVETSGDDDVVLLWIGDEGAPPFDLGPYRVGTTQQVERFAVRATELVG